MQDGYSQAWRLMIRVPATQCEPGLEALVPADASNGALLLFLWTQVWGTDLIQGGKRHGLKIQLEGFPTALATTEESSS